MSHGYGGSAYKLSEDANQVLYNYCVYNVNTDVFGDRDGSFTIDKKYLVKPEIHTKVKKINGRKKEIVKRIPRDVPYDDIVKVEGIQVENSESCFAKDSSGMDYIAMTLVSKVFNYYQELGTLPIAVHAHY